MNRIAPAGRKTSKSPAEKISIPAVARLVMNLLRIHGLPNWRPAGLVYAAREAKLDFLKILFKCYKRLLVQL